MEDARSEEEHPDIVVPAFSFSKGHSAVSKENVFPNYSTWESIESTGKPLPRSSDEELSVLTNQNYRMSSESRQDSFSGSSVVSREVSLLEDKSREAPPEAARESQNHYISPPPEAARPRVLHSNRSFMHKKQHNASNPRKFTLRPKSIVRKWNRYADMEEKGLAASPRHRTKLAKSHLHLELLAATSSSDSNDDDPTTASENVVSMPVEEEEEEEEGSLPPIQEFCTNREVQFGYKEADDNVSETRVSLISSEESTLPSIQESCASREVQDDEQEDPVEVSLDCNSSLSGDPSHDAPVETFCQDDFQRITENGFPAIVLDGNELSESELASKVTICTTNESESPSLSSISDNETDESSSNQSMQTDTKNQCARQEEIVTLSLAQILVQSYQPDPNNPGYWKRKEADCGTNRNVSTSRSFLRKDSPLPTLNTFLAEVSARRNEIMTKSNQPKAHKKEDEEQSAPMVDWYGVKRQSKQASQARPQFSNLGKQTNHGSPKGLLAELKTKRREIVGRPAVNKTKQKRVVVCNPSPGSANDLLSELKAKQQELKHRTVVHPKKETSVNDDKGTGFLPDLMTELKAKQRELKSRPASPVKRADPVAAKRSAGSKPGVMSELKARQREIEDRFYSRLANFKSTFSGNAGVVIPDKS